MVRVIIIDDEINVRIVIKKLLSLIEFEHEIVGEASSVTEALQILKTTKVDIVLLDVELKGGTGFDVLKKLTNYDFQLIFITAFNKYAIKAFKFNALDYIVKPIDPDELETAINKAKLAINSKNQLSELLKNLEHNNNLEKLVIRTTQKTYFININDIYFLQSEGSYSKIFLKEKTILTSKNLKYFYEILPTEIFIKTHKSYVVNINYIDTIVNNQIVLNNNFKVLVSTRKITEIKKKIGF